MDGRKSIFRKISDGLRLIAGTVGSYMGVVSNVLGAMLGILASILVISIIAGISVYIKELPKVT